MTDTDDVEDEPVLVEFDPLSAHEHDDNNHDDDEPLLIDQKDAEDEDHDSPVLITPVSSAPQHEQGNARIPEDDELPHNATTHNAALDLDFDRNSNEIMLNIKDEITGKCWKTRLSQHDFDDDTIPIRQQYNALGQTVAAGVCSYVYPLNNSTEPIVVTITHQQNQYTFTVPDERAPKVTPMEDQEGTPSYDTNHEEEKGERDDEEDEEDAVFVDSLVPTKKTPAKDGSNMDEEDEDEANIPSPPQPPDSLNAPHADDSPPAPNKVHMADGSFFFDEAPEQVVIAAGGIAKMSNADDNEKPAMANLDGVVTGGGPDVYHMEDEEDGDDEKHAVMVPMNADMLNEGEPIPMGGKAFALDAPRKKDTLEMGMPSHKSTEVIEDEEHASGRGTVLDPNNRAARTFVASQEEEKQREEERLQKQREAARQPSEWYDEFAYEAESRYLPCYSYTHNFLFRTIGLTYCNQKKIHSEQIGMFRPWWLPIDAFDNNDQTVDEMRRPSMALATFDDQLPKTAVTSQSNLLKRQLYHARQQKQISQMHLNAEKINEALPDESGDEDYEEDEVTNDPLKRKKIDIAGLGSSTSADELSPNTDEDTMHNAAANSSGVAIGARGQSMNENLLLMNQLQIDFNVIIRKFILYTSVFFTFTFCSLIAGASLGFYAWKGYITNSLLLLLFGVGIFIGFRSEKHWSFTARLNYISYYWLLCWIALILIFAVSALYVFLLPSKYANYCDSNDCTVNTASMIVVFIAAVLTLVSWCILSMFYIDCMCRLIIISGRFYDLWSRLTGLTQLIHRQCYRFRAMFGNFRVCMSRNTGMRLDDFIHSSCFCKYCQRKSEIIINDRRSSEINMYPEWQPFEPDGAMEYRKEHRLCRGLKLNCCARDVAKHQRRSSYDYTGGERIDCTENCPCFRCCTCCASCGGCLEQCTEGTGLCCSSCLFRLRKATCCGCCRKEDGFGSKTEARYNCHECSCGKLKCDCHWLCNGEASFYLCGCIVLMALLLFPLALFIVIAFPFWCLAQCVAAKSDSKKKFWRVVVVFVIALIPPFIVWFVLLTAMCDQGEADGGRMMCFLWNVVQPIYE